MWRKKHVNFIVVALALIEFDAILLMLPAATHTDVQWGETIFAATTAVTVTGLAVLDTGSDFTLLDQAVILLLIKLGGYT